MKYSHILWDFNGTIFNDVDIGIKSANILLTRHGLPQIKGKSVYRNLFCFPIIEYYKKLGFDFDKTSYNELAAEWVDIYTSLIPEASLYNGVIRLLQYIKCSSSKQMILSATESEMLTAQLKSLNIFDYFDEVLGTGDIYAHGKKDIALIWAKKALPTKALLIGDTSHDKEVADSAGFDCLLISEGHESKERLLKTGVEVCDSIFDVLDWIE